MATTVTVTETTWTNHRNLSKKTPRLSPGVFSNGKPQKSHDRKDDGHIPDSS